MVIGGSTKNRLLMRLKASVFGAGLGVVDLPDATCLGAALLGGLAAGLFHDLDQARAGLRLTIHGVEPDPAWSEEFRERRLATYAAAYGRDPEFYAFHRSLESYRQAFSDGKSVMVLDPSTEFFRYFEDAGRGQ